VHYKCLIDDDDDDVSFVRLLENVSMTGREWLTCVRNCWQCL